MELNSELDRLQKYAEIDSELNRAKKKWPNWPENIFEQLAVMQEEAGEVTMAVLHYVHEGGNIEDVKSELIQTAAMCMRMLENLPMVKWLGQVLIKMQNNAITDITENWKVKVLLGKNFIQRRSLFIYMNGYSKILRVTVI